MESRDLKVFIILFLSLACCATASTDRPASSPVIQKVVMISIDTLRADFLGCYNPKMKTGPELDQFAAANVICRNVTAQAATTAPSHKSIFYSVYPSIHKTSIHSVPEEKLQSPVEIIRAEGFKTAAFTWLDQHYNDKFFLFLHTFEVHCPYDPPENFF